ncbi:MAG TPA: PHB depolymerase family esterase [Gaiellaceae bacterium]|nr:PHB depolymerase family esterase [Gaiellaceae bacterium]
MRMPMKVMLALVVALLATGCSSSTETPRDSSVNDASPPADTLNRKCYDGCIEAGKSAEVCKKSCSKPAVDRDGGKTDPCVDGCLKGGKTAGECKTYCTYGVYQQPHGDACLPQKQGSYDRCWIEYVPKTVVSKPPLIIDLHGWGATPEFLRTLSRWPLLADKEGFVVVWPFGVGKSWNAGAGCCIPASTDNIDDVGFLKALIAEMVKSNGVDAKRVYLSGHSNGCAMAQRFANEASDAAAAVACMSHYLLVGADPEYTPVSVMEVHGNTDTTVGYQAGEQVGAVANLQKWKTMNGCTGSPVVTSIQGKSSVQTYGSCKGGTEVSLVTLDEVGHYPYCCKAITIDTTKMAWDFMRRFSRP